MPVLKPAFLYKEPPSINGKQESLYNIHSQHKEGKYKWHNKCKPGPVGCDGKQ